MVSSNAELVQRARETGTVIPSFNIPYLPMMEPVVRALRDTECMGFIAVARLEWVKFGSGSLEAVREEYERVKDPRHTRLHLDHVPVVDEDGLQVNYLPIMERAVELGYESIMIDGSRLSLEENIAATSEVVAIGHNADPPVPVEAELGAVMGHEEGPLPPYEGLFASGKGFTDVEEAARFVRETEVDWLSVAIGNVHGAIARSRKDEKKVQARLNIDRLDLIHEAVKLPIVLHGGTGIRKADVLESIRHGIAKINIGAATRQPYEAGVEKSVEDGRQAVYDAVRRLVREELETEGSAGRLVLGVGE